MFMFCAMWQFAVHLQVNWTSYNIILTMAFFHSKIRFPKQMTISCFNDYARLLVMVYGHLLEG